MRQLQKFSLTLLLATLASPAMLLAQNEDKAREKEVKAKKEGEQIIITRKGNNDSKTIIEVQGDKVIVNGKEVKEGDEDAEVSVRRHKIKDVWAYGPNVGNVYNGYGDHFNSFNIDENKAMLGVTTESVDNGVEIQSITKESGAEKAGLKKGDVITKIGDKKIEDPDDLSETIQDHKPGDKVTVTYLRDKKENKVTAELGKYKGVRAFTVAPNQNFNFQLDDLDHQLRKIQGTTAPRMNWNWSGGGPKLGVSVQDTEDGKGVNVIDVDEDGNAGKAGIKEDDIITEVDGKAVNSADEIAKVIRESREKSSVKVKLLRKGKAETFDIKIPKKLKSADL